MNLIIRIVILICWLASSSTSSAKSVELKHDNLILNANYLPAEDKTKPFFLVLHGTFASHQMEIIEAVQALLLEEEYGSLAITLSLGENNRKGFFDCSHPIISTHDNAESELGLWLNQIESWGYNSVILVGHSRGGAQIASFAQANHSKVQKVFLIAPLVWNKEREQANFQSTLNLPLDSVLEKLQSNPQMRLDKQRVLHCKNAYVTAESFLSYYDEYPEKNTPAIIKSTSIPTKVYLGDSDPLTDDFLAQMKLLPANKNITIKTIEDADHFFRDFGIDDIVTDMIEEIQ